MTEMDWPTGADGHTGVTVLGGAMGSIYSGDPGAETSTTTLVSFRNSQVLRTALTALTEP